MSLPMFQRRIVQNWVKQDGKKMAVNPAENVVSGTKWDRSGQSKQDTLSATTRTRGSAAFRLAETPRYGASGSLARTTRMSPGMASTMRRELPTMASNSMPRRCAPMTVRSPPSFMM